MLAELPTADLFGRQVDRLWGAGASCAQRNPTADQRLSCGDGFALRSTAVTAPTPRRAGRVLLVDDDDRVLLLRGGDPGAPERGQWWFTPGGGLESGEQPEQAAARELAEETGLSVDPAALGEPVHKRVTEFRLDGRDYRQSEHYYLLRVPSHEVDVSGPDAVVDPGVTDHRWWSLAELQSSADVRFPVELPDVLTRLGVR